MSKNYRGNKGVDGDDYRPLKFYQDRISGVGTGFDSFSEGDEYYFTYNLDGQVIFISEGYSSKKGRDNGIQSVDKNRSIETRYRRGVQGANQYYFDLLAGNHQEIGTSAWFESEAAMEAAIARMMGVGVAPVAGIVGVSNSAERPVLSEALVSSEENASEKSSGCTCAWLWWLLPILLFLLVWYLFSQCCSLPKNDVKVVADTSHAVSVDGANSLGEFQDASLPDGVVLNVPELGVENQLIEFIEDNNRPVDKTTWFNFDRISFATGKADLTLDSREQVRNIANILNAYPDVKLKIGGYTDNTGSLQLNMALSQDRAESVMNALISQGVAQERLQAEGYGPEHPVASNDTEQGRAQNRRIALRVTEK